MKTARARLLRVSPLLSSRLAHPQPADRKAGVGQDSPARVFDRDPDRQGRVCLPDRSLRYGYDSRAKTSQRQADKKRTLAPYAGRLCRQDAPGLGPSKLPPAGPWSDRWGACLAAKIARLLGTDGSNPSPSSGESGELPCCAAGSMSYREPTLFADNAPRRTMRERLHCGSSCTRKSAGHCAGSSPFRVLGASKRTANIPTHREQFLQQDPALVLRPPGRGGRRLSGFGGQVFRELTGGRYITLRRSDLSKLIYDRISGWCPHARSAISAILRNVNTRRRFASGSFAISASVSAIVVPYA